MLDSEYASGPMVAGYNSSLANVVNVARAENIYKMCMKARGYWR
jgi:hypothetical protein